MATASDVDEHQDLQEVTSNFKLPPFPRTGIDMWFLQLEMFFSLKRIASDNTRFSHLVCTLPSEAVREVQDFIRNPPPTDRYTRLKQLILDRLSETDEDRIMQILYSEQLGDRKPSQFLRRLQELRGGLHSISNDLLRTIFIKRLPTNIQMVLAASTEVDLEKLALLADKTYAISPPAIQEISYEDLQREVESLRSIVSSSSSRSSSSSGRPASRKQGTLTTKTEVDPEPEVCWYHRKFGQQATRCRKPCSFQGNGEGSH
jgi:hypothetical protein